MKQVFLIAGICVAMFASAQEKEGSNIQTEHKPSGDFATISTAQNLAAYGYENKDALSLLTAAKMMSAIPVKDENARGITQSSDKNAGMAGKDTAHKKAISLDPEKLLADAKKMAAGDDATLSYVNTMAKNIKPQARGAESGPVLHYDRVYAHTTDSYNIRFYGGERAKIALKGDGDTDLDLYVYDYSGNLIDYDDDYSDGCYVEWTPKWTGTFTVKIKNRGNVYNNYTLATN